MGGQGGGVLSDWIVELAESQGWHAQSTSVPGVAQRTGATLYYVEMLPPKDGQRADPVADAGAGRSRCRARRRTDGGRALDPARPGHARPHDADRLDPPFYAVAEKEKPGDAIADPNMVVEAAGVAAKRVIAFDMESAGEQEQQRDLGLPVRHAGRFRHPAVCARELRSGDQIRRAAASESSLKAFAAAYDQTRSRRPPRSRWRESPPSALRRCPLQPAMPDLDQLLARIREFPATAACDAVCGRQAPDRFSGSGLCRRVSRPRRKDLRTRPQPRRRRQERMRSPRRRRNTSPWPWPTTT